MILIYAIIFIHERGKWKYTHEISVNFSYNIALSECLISKAVKKKAIVWTCENNQGSRQKGNDIIAFKMGSKSKQWFISFR